MGLIFSGTFDALLKRVEQSPIQHGGKTFEKKDVVTLLSQFLPSGEFVRLPSIIKKLYDKDFSVLDNKKDKRDKRDSPSDPNSSISMAMAFSHYMP